MISARPTWPQLVRFLWVVEPPTDFWLDPFSVRPTFTSRTAGYGWRARQLPGGRLEVFRAEVGVSPVEWDYVRTLEAGEWRRAGDL